jgi:hypothetical protein
VLTRHVKDDEIATHARSTDLAHGVERLIDLANQRGGEDNVTVVLYATRLPLLAAVQARFVSFVLALLVVGVIAGVIAALVIASGALLFAR